MRLVVGLGNPGAGYARNRHNVGFMAVDEIVRRHRLGPWRAKYQGELSEGPLGPKGEAGDKLLAFKPQTFMNLSGDAVGALMRFYKIAPADLVVFHDELDLAPGKVKAKLGGGAGGHNGLRSLDDHIGPDYWRVRIGIGHPGIKELVSPWVLSDFPKADEAWLGPLLAALAAELPLMLAGQPERYMTRVALLTAPPKPKKEKKSEPTGPDSNPGSAG